MFVRIGTTTTALTMNERKKVISSCYLPARAAGQQPFDDIVARKLIDNDRQDESIRGKCTQLMLFNAKHEQILQIQ